MLSIFNNSLLFNPEAHTIGLVGQPESALTLSAPAVRLLQEFVRNKGCDLSREELITRVWEAYGFTPSGNNLNKAVSELRKSFHALGERQDMIVTLPRVGFRFDADVISYPKQLSSTPEPSPIPVNINASLKRNYVHLAGWAGFFVLTAAAIAMGVSLCRFQGITAPVELKAINEKIGGCKFWFINEQDRPLKMSKIARLLDANNVMCQQDEYDIYYFSERLTLSAADEIFIGACPVNDSRPCKSIRYKSGPEE
ncbi:winged helix-turn-helix domain-containing protein [Enterobacter sichuanensis]|uniref:Winged helix-turn-helix domain-containing protein n=1 Tax=Enterobacter sichuanensis TaxID=2071710 RepID=A0ABS6GDB2_9ENTR|nr:winged helix-turn-helix domain-containing protein [Enterobacter sichuanensis]MBU5923914.1 winged helix-turn-helix domain-containing protein [Enterobacter sichuanensis]OZV02425.1 transcriptional regulator [Enterobacter cloacae]PAO15637.1 transcriptional regulator [Enterobacter cloacae]